MYNIFHLSGCAKQPLAVLLLVYHSSKVQILQSSTLYFTISTKLFANRTLCLFNKRSVKVFVALYTNFVDRLLYKSGEQSKNI